MSSHALRWLTKRSQRARVEAVGRWGASGAATVTIGQLIASLRRLWRRRCCSVLRELGGSAVGEEGGRENEMRARTGAGGCWGVEGARLPALAALGRAPATRGQPRVHAAAKT